MKEKFIENGIEHVGNGDYYIPNLTIPDDKLASTADCTQYLLKKTDLAYIQ